MDFGDILNQWESKDSRKKDSLKYNTVSSKKANAPSKDQKAAMKQGYSYEDLMNEQNSQRRNPMEVWLSRYGTFDKDKVEEEKNKNKRFENVEYLRNMKCEARIDLHQLTRDEAWKTLNEFVTNCKNRGLKKILIVHGKGIHSNGSDPVLGPMVRIFIEQDSRLGLSGHPDRNGGGNGATWVIIK